jgi:carboxypeptidase family protein/TonB-dependent receptor-like protein
MTLKALTRIAACLLLTLVFGSSARAQFQSAIEGTISDSSGARIPDVKVTLINVDTGVSQTAQTNSVGFYSFPSLGPGKYKVTVAAKGFASVTQENITLGGSETRTVELVLKVGDVAEQVTVTAEPPPIQLTEPKVGTSITSFEVRNLPMAGRNILDLASLTAGVTGVGNLGQTAGGNDIFSLTGNPSINANGQRGDGNGFYVDAASVNSNPDPGTFYVVPNPDAIAEFSIALNDYSAEYGRSGSVVINAVTKSGSNNFHGSIFEYHRDSKLTARNVFQNTVNPLTGRVLPATRRNEFGGSLGGPIQKDKMFFFFSWDQLRSSNAVTRLVTQETPEFVNFMKTNFPNNLSTFLLTHYPMGDVGPFRAGTVQTVAQVMTVFGLPACNGTGPLGMPCNMPIRGTAVQDFAPTRNGLQWNVRADRYFDKGNDRIYVNGYRRTADVGAAQQRPEFRAGFATHPITDYVNINWTHTFSPTMINEGSVAFTRFIGNQDCLHCEVPPIAAPGLSEGFGNGFAPTRFIQNDYHWRDILTISRGTHSLKGGVEIFRDQENDLFSAAAQRPSYNFLNLFDFAGDTVLTESGVNYDLRTGGPSFQDVQYRSTTYGLFAQDNWRLKKNLSLNLGLRWDFSSNPYEKNGRLSTILLGSGSTFQERLANASVGIVPNVFETHRIGYVAPRFSFAWAPSRLDNKLSIRGGIGVFMIRWPNIAWSDRVRDNPPYEAGVNASTQVPTGPQPVYGFCGLDVSPFNCPFPTGLKIGVNERGGPIGANGLPVRAGIGGTAPDLRYAYTINRFFGIQYAFSSKWIFEADYLGSQAVHLYSNTDRNRFVGDLSFDATRNRINQFFAGMSYTDNSAWAHSNSATFTLRKRFSQGYTITSAYTMSKTLSVQDATGVGRDSFLSPVVDAYNLNAQRGLAAFDIPKRFTFSFVYDVPKHLFENRIASAIIGNWQVGTIGIFEDGYPFWVQAGLDLNGDGAGPDVPFTPSFGNSKSTERSDFLTGFMKPSDFPLPACTRRNAAGTCVGWASGGDLGRNTFRGPGLANIDMSLGRSFHIPWFVGKEGANFQFRAEFYNLFNRVNLDPRSVVGNMQDGNFSKATGVFNPRTIQLGARIDF